MKRLLRAVGRAVAWPFRRLLDPRVADLGRRIEHVRATTVAEADATRARVDSYAEASRATLAQVGRELAEVVAALDAIERRLETVERPRAADGDALPQRPAALVGDEAPGSAAPGR